MKPILLYTSDLNPFNLGVNYLAIGRLGQEMAVYQIYKNLNEIPKEIRNENIILSMDSADNIFEFDEINSLR